ncbi:MAG: hypothetical protein K5849_01570 [Bacteroidales bacterium]|nr:hypothetical protein [Bacteroidales bacterium]
MPDNWFFSRFRIGMEWGYSQCFYRGWNYNFISEEGSRFYDRSYELHLKANGIVLGQIGFNMNKDRFNLSLLSGYIGVGENNQMIPFLLRFSYYPRTAAEDGMFAFAQAGPGLHIFPGEREAAWLASLGAGYRITLSLDCNLDLLLGIKYLYDHPLIPNPEGPGYVPRRNIRKNNAGYCALDLTLAVNF